MTQTSPMESLRAELLSDVAAQVAERCTDFGIAPEVAEQIGAAAADHLADHWGGQVISIPKDHAYRLAQRDLEILYAYRQERISISALALRYKMTQRGMRRLLQRAEQRHPTLDQPQLFP